MKKSGNTATSNTITGKISINSRGVGFVGADNLKSDVRIEMVDLNCALPSDTVEVLFKKSNDELSGKVTKIVTRNKINFVGTLELKNGNLFLNVDDKRVYTPIILPFTVGEEATAVVGKKAYVEMTKWNDPRAIPEGKILKIIGEKGENNAEIESIVLDKGLAIDFPTAVVAEANKIGANGTIPDHEIARREDFRKILTMTIDPADAKDFDDAISVEILSDKKWRVGVHIADVSHYVLPHTALDKEASERGCSVYLVDRTIPMLPNILSDNLCSLNPNEDKLTFSAIFIIDEAKPNHFVIANRSFKKTVIRSAKRFSYEEAQKVIDNGGIHQKELLILRKIAWFLREEKYKKGAIDFDTDEVRFQLDKLGKPIRVYKKERLETHKIVEEWMLLANRAVAEYIFGLTNKGTLAKPFLYRIHDIPNEERIKNLQIFVKSFGHELVVGKKGVNAKSLQALIMKIKGSAEEGLIKTAVLRSMAKAIYSVDNIGHFGLAFEHYTHFTSPIRRYPDTLVHRFLEKHLNGEQVTSNELVDLDKHATHSTDQEIKASEAERASIKMKQVEFMQNKIGQEFMGTISGVTEWGFYIEENETKSEGLVKMRDLKDDFYELDEKNYRIVGKKNKRKFTLGDKIKFKIVGADLERRTLDFAI